MAELAQKTSHISEAEQEIRRLAAMHKIEVSKTDLDAFADDVTRLSGDDVDLDDVQQLVVELGRAKVLPGPELTKLHAQYLNERN